MLCGIKKVPKSIAFVGGDFISLEFANVFNCLGSKVFNCLGSNG
ncbi:MAG: NAD-binding protein [Candidatus Lokiarchaeota archaeon]|nr:NAD-binding protein [Candidatus Lokiarchaeota archaeon]